MLVHERGECSMPGFPLIFSDFLAREDHPPEGDVCPVKLHKQEKCLPFYYIMLLLIVPLLSGWPSVSFHWGVPDCRIHCYERHQKLVSHDDLCGPQQSKTSSQRQSRFGDASTIALQWNWPSL